MRTKIIKLILNYMGVYSANQSYKNLFTGFSGNGISIPIFAADFKTVKFSLTAIYSISLGAVSGGPFVIGETVTGGTSGATGIVVAVTESGLFVTLLTGTDFVANETITGSTSSATATSVNVLIPDYNIRVLQSNQDAPPDPSLPYSSINQYSGCTYTDDSQDSVAYSFTTPFNPSTATPAGSQNKTFNISDTGARWYFILITDYVSGLVNQLDAELFSNFT